MSRAYNQLQNIIVSLRGLQLGLKLLKAQGLEVVGIDTVAKCIDNAIEEGQNDDKND